MLTPFRSASPTVVKISHRSFNELDDPVYVTWGFRVFLLALTFAATVDVLS